MGGRPRAARPGAVRGGWWRIEDDLHPEGGDRQQVFDQRALEQYKRRIEDLRAELEEAERNNDPERAARAREELDFILDEIGRVTPSRVPKVIPGEAERARVNVTKAIKSAITKIREHDASLGHHLDHDIRTGTYCAYEPDHSTAPRWIL